MAPRGISRKSASVFLPEKIAMSTCPICKGEVISQAGRGRPARFCSPRCRRAAEIEIARITHRIAGLERTSSGLRTTTYRTGWEPDENLIVVELARQNERLLD